jgi:hypothetical protein
LELVDVEKDFEPILIQTHDWIGNANNVQFLQIYLILRIVGIKDPFPYHCRHFVLVSLLLLFFSSFFILLFVKLLLCYQQVMLHILLAIAHFEH